MRKIRFIVDDQTIRLDPNCDLSGFIPGATDKVLAEFYFSKEWDCRAKAAAFYSPLGIEYEPRVLTSLNTCLVPYEALMRRSFKVQIFGKQGDATIKTNKITVYQNGGTI